MYQYHKSS